MDRRRSKERGENPTVCCLLGWKEAAGEETGGKHSPFGLLVLFTRSNMSGRNERSF